ncbi:16S rRNA (guanine(966)-N(2))-methyltransferase RsmD [Candidatus Nitronereus thalassa]|uniref:16S rRNA (Guanine(966)-N(2))-methyltransferase RsmD n=1 Tax=Candidatus Nitronereus thalassa TaxID=3020898 RepID=A0ABU3KCW2_9BACT|nr:16S rRNA (guanine(966)-N(2))-methyltransferase RsmD [Candidatus Nitronereus thalassa]MDT7044007.1 16S rRNA (guanine(966)-N(2))-methyltransferase RsmD [Candidatus Nitronereus thalassa]
MTMRVVAGFQKGRRLKQPTGRGLRPTSARVKEALFSIIAERLTNANVLDLYAGTGALGLEALSRGARKVIFVENQPTSIQILRENIALCELMHNSTIIDQDVTEYLSADFPRRDDHPFDLVFADPPYEVSDLEPLLKKLDTCDKLASHGLVVVEHFKKTSLPVTTGRLHQTRQARYGDTILTFYKLFLPLKDDSCG